VSDAQRVGFGRMEGRKEVEEERREWGCVCVRVRVEV
jgi:hypothetical protein